MSREIVHKVADKTGKFYCLVPNGSYSIKMRRKMLMKVILKYLPKRE